jgi:hypothetical protein
VISVWVARWRCPQRRAGWRSRRRHGKGRQSKDEFGWGTVQATLRREASGWSFGSYVCMYCICMGSCERRTIRRTRTVRYARTWQRISPVLLGRTVAPTTNIMYTPASAACAHRGWPLAHASDEQMRIGIDRAVVRTWSADGGFRPRYCFASSPQNLLAQAPACRNHVLPQATNKI